MSGLVEYLRSGCLIAEGSGDLWMGVGPAARSDYPIPGSLAIYSPDFFLDDPKPWYCFLRREKVSATKLAQKFQFSASEDLGVAWEATCRQPSKEIFQQLFTFVQNQLKVQAFKKVVPVVFETALFAMTDERLRFFLSRLLTYVEGWPLFVYGLWDGRRGVLGATPEILFAQDEDGLRSMALAGTRLKDRGGGGFAFKR